MKSILIGLDANGKAVHVTPQMRKVTHMHVIGGSGTGKSKALEGIGRQDVRSGHGLCLIDWHGTLYKDVVRFCSQFDIGINDYRDVILLNPSRADFITGFNPFMSKGDDISVQVRNRIDATIRPWGITDTNAMPTFERVCTILYTFAVENQQPLFNAAKLLQFDKPEVRKYALEVVSDSYVKAQLQQLLSMKSFRDWSQFVLSAENRIGRFLASKAVKRFMGLAEGNINLREIMDQGKILLVNLGASGFLDRESARVFASLLLNEFFETAMIRANEAKDQGIEPSTFPLYLDEFQEYITEDIAAMLDQVRKGGLHMVLAHQHLGHLADNARLRKSIFANARIRAVFGGLDYEDASILANEMFLPDLNTRQIKKAYYHTIHLYEEQTRTSRSRNWGSGSSESRSNQTGKSSTAGHGYSYSEGVATGRGSTHGRGSTSGRTYSSTSGSGTGSSSGVGQNQTVGTPMGEGLAGANVEGWFSEGRTESSSQSSSQFQTTSFADSQSDALFSSESEWSSESKSHTRSISFADSESLSEGETFGESQFETEGETEVPVWVPIPVQELATESEWSREEKVSKVAELLKTQQQRHCFIKIDTENTQPLKIPFVREYSQSAEFLLEYEKAIYEAQGAIPSSKVDLLIQESENKFLLTVADRKTEPEPRPGSNASATPGNEPKRPSRRKRPARSIFSQLDPHESS